MVNLNLYDFILHSHLMIHQFGEVRALVGLRSVLVEVHSSVNYCFHDFSQSFVIIFVTNFDLFDY